MKVRIEAVDVPYAVGILAAGIVLLVGGCANPAGTGQQPAITATQAPTAAATLLPTAAPTVAPTAAPAPTTAPTSAPASELSEAALKNATYELPDLGKVQLKDARYENQYGPGATQVNRVGYQTAAFGDINGDGTKDAVVILWTNTGGTGTFIYLVPVINKAGAPQQAGVEFLGDRVRLGDLFIANGKITAVARSDPRGTGPQMDTTWVFQVEGTSLKKLSEQTAPADYTSLGNLAGTYKGTVSGVSGGDRQITLALLANRTATMTTQLTGGSAPTTEKGTWSGSGTTVRLSITESNGKPFENDVTFELRGSELTSTEWDKSLYGSTGLKLTRQQ